MMSPINKRLQFIARAINRGIDGTLANEWYRGQSRSTVTSCGNDELLRRIQEWLKIKSLKDDL